MSVSSSPVPTQGAPARPQAVRHFGRFQLLQLLGKSERSMLWLVADPRNGQDLILAMPRARPADATALERWQALARKATRVDHPGLAHVTEVGEHDRWPYIAYDRANQVTLAERLGRQGMPAQELVPLALRALQGLAFAHEAGLGHHDLQLSMLLLGEQGSCRLLGLGVALAASEGTGLQSQREGAERDLLAFGLLLHQGLSGQAALEQPDFNLAIERMPPLGREIVRLPWDGAHPIPEPLRAIVNRATDRQERQRYRNARTLERALEGWLQTEGEQGGGPLALLMDRLRSVGTLPAMPGGAGRAARLAMMERERTSELAEIVLQDLALTFELMRQVNSAQVRGAMAAGSAPILTIRRTISMLGLDGVRRAALSLRAWPGPMDDGQAAALERLIERVRRAGRIAQWLRPAGYDGEVVYLLALMQNLGRLLVQYHFPDEATQIRRLMQPAPAAKPGDPEEPGMSEAGASFAVLGVDIEALGAAVARLWGLEDSVLHMIRRAAAGAPVRAADSDDEMLRLSASCANEVVDVCDGPPQHLASGLQRVAQRYARTLGLTLRDIQLAAQGIEPGSPEATDGAGTRPAPLAGAT